MEIRSPFIISYLNDFLKRICRIFIFGCTITLMPEDVFAFDQQDQELLTNNSVTFIITLDLQNLSLKKASDLQTMHQNNPKHAPLSRHLVLHTLYISKHACIHWLPHICVVANNRETPEQKSMASDAKYNSFHSLFSQLEFPDKKEDLLPSGSFGFCESTLLGRRDAFLLCFPLLFS